MLIRIPLKKIGLPFNDVTGYDLQIQVALAIFGFNIRSFDYLRFHLCSLNLISADFPLIIHGFSYILPQKRLFGENSSPWPCCPGFCMLIHFSLFNKISLNL